MTTMPCSHCNVTLVRSLCPGAFTTLRAGQIEINIHFCIVRHLPLKTNCLSTLLQQCSTVKYASLSETLPWDDLIARTLDFEVDRRKMAGKSCWVCWQGWVYSFHHTFFSWLVVVFPDLEFRRHVLWHTYLCLCPCRCRLNWAARFWVPICSCSFFYFHWPPSRKNLFVTYIKVPFVTIVRGCWTDTT